MDELDSMGRALRALGYMTDEIRRMSGPERSKLFAQIIDGSVLGPLCCADDLPIKAHVLTTAEVLARIRESEEFRGSDPIT